MSGYALTPLAKADIFDIWSYIAEDNPDAAGRVEEAIYDACVFLAEGPLRGHSRPDLTARPVRFWTVARYPNYTVVYRPDTAPLQIIAVLHGKRNIRRILRGRRHAP
jgi:antitoxin ParD1/3/4